ncbi:MAG: lysophospholipase [Clostridia bacterium]|nr:lysophospholipase [Clostridia bacterium]
MAKYNTNRELLDAINMHLRNSGQNEINMNDFNLFYYGDVDKSIRVQRNQEQQDKVRNIYNKLTNLLINNNAANKDLKDELPEVIHATKKEYLRNLRETAQKTADAHAKKAEAKQINAERTAARLELEKIRKERAKAMLRAEGKENVTDKDVELKKVDNGGISAARGRHILTSALNTKGIGSRAERRSEAEYPVDPDVENFEPVECGSPEEGVRLKGGKYTPKGVPSNGKTVLVFTGSTDPGAKQINTIKDAYLANGYTVYQFDYRGFGKSHQINKNGDVVKSKISEQSMYKDGMVMYNHLVKKCNIPPKDIILHGYSLGASIASRVALESTKEKQEDLQLKGKVFEPKKHGIGGVVLHSPIRTMFKSSRALVTWFGAMIAKHHVGNYDTVQHMKDLAKIDSTIPVHLISGNKNPKNRDFDHLSHEFTGLDKALKGEFKTMTSHVGISDHFGYYGNELIPNVQANDVHLQNLARGRQPEVQVQNEPVQQGGAEMAL